MKFRTTIAIVMLCAATGLAQEHMADSLRNGILEEDSKQNPRGAVQQYQAVLTQFAEARQTAATALFRMAECYRKQGNRSQAIASYQRVLKDFADQTKLAAQSRTVLKTIYTVAPDGAPAAGDQSDRAKFEQLMQGQKQEQDKIDEARARYRATIEGEMEILRRQIADVNPGREDKGAIVDNLQMQILHLKRDLAAFDAGMSSPAVR